MDAEPDAQPLKVCPHCAVASKTEAEACPSCGKPYGRRRRRLPSITAAVSRIPLPGWAVAILIIVLAFGIGFGVRLLVDGGDSSTDSPAAQLQRAGIPYAKANKVSGTITPRQVIARFPGKPFDIQLKPKDNLTCYLYLLADRPGTGFQFCFRKGKLQSTGTVAG